MTPFDFLMLALATFYVAHAVANTHGPFGAFGDLRQKLPIGGLTSCLVCLSPWAAAFFYICLLSGATWLVWLFAGAGASVFVYRWTGGANL